ncbi:MAG: S-layer homology domain-containing protein [Firmicutes bacterium]|nr:S-layer homology domain-containing protein [Bacillota bacterium]
MKKVISIFVAATMLFLSITTTFAGDFSDISGHWAESTINKWKDKGIIAGYTDGTFKPDNPVTRAELAKILTEAFELKEKTSLEEYDDMDSSSWYYPYVQCSEKYIPVYPLAENYPSNMPYIENQEHSAVTYGFLPDVDAIRIHVAEALVEIKKEKDNITVELPPTIQEVADSVRGRFKNDIAYEIGLAVPGGGVASNVARMFQYTYLADELGIMTGDENGFHPYDKITRAELISVIDRMLSE